MIVKGVRVSILMVRDDGSEMDKEEAEELAEELANWFEEKGYSSDSKWEGVEIDFEQDFQEVQ
jgi:hypothetical protein